MDDMDGSAARQIREFKPDDEPSYSQIDIRFDDLRIGF